MQGVMLHEFVSCHRDEIISRCKAKVLTRGVLPRDPHIDHGVPVFLDQLTQALMHGRSSSPEIVESATLHGHDLLRQGFSVSQVVHDYGDVCQSLTELAVELNIPISTEDFRTLNQCLDDAIAGAVTEYGRERNQSTLDTETARGTERLGFLTHELRNLLNTAMLAFEVLRSGKVGVGGNTGQVLARSLAGARNLIGRSVDDIRHNRTGHHSEQFLVSDFMEDIASAATLEATAKNIKLSVIPVECPAWLEADRSVLAAVLTNLLQNAFKFTRPHTTVTLRAGASAERVLLDVQDECGGLPGSDTSELFRPFEQRSANRSGLGLGLAFSRSAIEANGGRIYARNLPGTGCVFTVDLPRLAVPNVTICNT
jgi:signal transduction histidine kinase